MKTAVDISDALLDREEGLRRVLHESAGPTTYRLPDRSVGVEGGATPLDALSWQDLRAESSDRDFALFPELTTRDPFA